MRYPNQPAASVSVRMGLVLHFPEAISAVIALRARLIMAALYFELYIEILIIFRS
jgi:hypothetical protein